MATFTAYPFIIRVLMLTMRLLTRFLHLNVRHNSNRTKSASVFDKENTHKLDVSSGILRAQYHWSQCAHASVTVEDSTSEKSLVVFG